jgi:hypothetical protein
MQMLCGWRFVPSIAITVLRVRHSMSWQKNFARLPGRQ